MERRALLVGLAGGLLAAPLAAEAQETGKVWRIGLLVGGPAPGEHPCVLALRRGFTDFGYVEGRTHVLEIRWAEGRPEDTFPRLGAELASLGVGPHRGGYIPGAHKGKESCRLSRASRWPLRRVHS
jgi:putative ABC transport system substrate-binding protein